LCIDIKVAVISDLNSYVKSDPNGLKYAFILDEYYEMINSAKMFPLILNEMPAIFTVGNKHTTVLVTGHYSTGFKRFLNEHFDSLKADFCHDEYEFLKNKQNLDGVVVNCLKDEKKLLKKFEEQIII